MNYTSIIKEFITDNFLFGDSGILNENTNLFEKGILDSTGVIELVAFIEMNFELTIEDYELVKENFSTINKISAFLQSKILNPA